VPKADSINGRLISFAIANGGLAAKDLPSRLKLLNWGKNETVKGPVTVGPETLRSLSANQKSVGFEHIALDYNHQTVPSSPNFKKDPVGEKGDRHVFRVDSSKMRVLFFLGLLTKISQIVQFHRNSY
jgi:hypothetical protein